MNRRGYIFTILSLVIILIVVAGITLRAADRHAVDASLYSHILSANAFIEQLDNDIPRVLYITGFRALLGLEEHVTSEGAYLNNFSDPFRSVMTNGTVNGTFYQVMENATLDDYEERVQEIAAGFGLSLDLSLENITASHVSAFQVRIDSRMRVLAETRDAGTRWNYTTNVSSVFSIDQLKDPLYAVETLGRVPTIITPVNISKPWVTADNDTTGLETIYNDSMYVPDPTGPSFLMRFTGNLSGSPFGIASLVDTRLLDDQEIAVDADKSVVDHIYFNATADPAVDTVVNMPCRVLIDDAHLVTFNASEKHSSDCTS